MYLLRYVRLDKDKHNSVELFVCLGIDRLLANLVCKLQNFVADAGLTARETSLWCHKEVKQ